MFYAENSLRSLYVNFGAFYGITLGTFFYSIHFSYPCYVGGNVELGVGGSTTQLPGFSKLLSWSLLLRLFRNNDGSFNVVKRKEHGAHDGLLVLVLRDELLTHHGGMPVIHVAC